MKLTENQIRRIVRKVIAESLYGDQAPKYIVQHWNVEQGMPDDLFDEQPFESLTSAKAYFNKHRNNVFNSGNGYLKLVSSDGKAIASQALNKKQTSGKKSAGRDDWAQERAMQAGMSFGTQGYNDEMGW